LLSVVGCELLNDYRQLSVRIFPMFFRHLKKMITLTFTVLFISFLVVNGSSKSVGFPTKIFPSCIHSNFKVCFLHISGGFRARNTNTPDSLLHRADVIASSKRRSKKVNRKQKLSDNVSVDKRQSGESTDSSEIFHLSDDRSPFSLPFGGTIAKIASRTPPITLGYLFTSVTVTVLAFFFNSNQWPSFLSFSWKSILKGQLWRLISGFFFLGPLDIFYPLTLQFIWQNMSQLEKLSYKEPEEFVTLLLFGCFSLVLVYSLIGLPMTFLGHNLGAYLLYIWSKLFEGMDVNFMDLFVLKSELLPYFFCLQSLLLEQQIPYGDIIGIIIGYLYSMFRQRNLLNAPSFFNSFFRQNLFLRKQYEKFRDDFE
jgi:hypothetical protein